MKKLITIAALSVAMITTGFAQSNLKGPQYKNAQPSEKFKGTSELLIRENPRQFQAAEYKNLNTRNYEKEILESEIEFLTPSEDLMVSINASFITEEETTEKIVYRRVDLADSEGINKKGLKGPAYKNFKR